MSEALQQPTNADKEPYISLKKLTRDQTAALQEVTIDTFVEGRGDDAREVTRVKLRLADKRAALVGLGKHLVSSRPGGGARNPAPSGFLEARIGS